MNVSKKNKTSFVQQGEGNKKELVNKVKEKYDLYENGKIDFNQLKRIITNDLNIEETQEFRNLASSAHTDNKTFPNLIKSLNIINNQNHKYPPFSSQEIKNSTTQKFHRYIKNKEERVQGVKEDNYIRENTQKLVEGRISTIDYQKILRDNGINPQIEEINKHIRGLERGDNVKYNELAYAVSRYKNSEFIPKNVEFKPERLVNSMSEADRERSMVTSSGNTPLYLPKKKTMKNDPNYFSQKDYYNWEENSKKEINLVDDEMRFSKLPFAKRETVDDIYKHKKVTPFGNNGNILLLGPQQGDNYKFGVKKRDPNVKSSPNEVESKVGKKNNRMFKESEENTLKFG